MIDRRKRPILYVDDTIEQRYAMRRILETEGFRVLEAGTGKEALAQLSASIALAVVDVRLPDISGYELAKRVKERQPNLPILQVSASFSNPDLRAAGLSGGADAYIAQPVHPGELTSLIRRMLRAAEAEESLRFLASVGPILSTSLDIDETVHNIQRVIVPAFADYSAVYLASVGVGGGFYWTDASKSEDRYRAVMKEPRQSHAASMVDKRHIIVSLQAAGKRLGSILFGLDGSREYTKTDLVMATDLSNRAGLALQNCLLFASEQLTRSALIRSEKLATAGRMSAAIAHEINNPLEAVTNLIYIIEQSPDVPEPMRDVATAALAEVNAARTHHEAITRLLSGTESAVISRLVGERSGYRRALFEANQVQQHRTFPRIGPFREDQGNQGRDSSDYFESPRQRPGSDARWWGASDPNCGSRRDGPVHNRRSWPRRGCGHRISDL
jgi:two-component system, NtrC family, sensor kinase